MIKFLFFINKIVFFVLLMINFTLFSLRDSYAFVYKNILHFNPYLFSVLIIISFFFLLIEQPGSNKLTFFSKPKVLKLSLVLIIIYIFLQNNFLLLRNAIPLVKFSLQNPSASYDIKMRTHVGPFYDFVKFVKENTPPNAVILHPVQQSRWPEVSNEGYTRYFIFPRELVSEGDEEKKENVTYIFIIGRKSVDGKSNSDQWPTEKISAKRLIYMPKAGQTESRILEKSYDPEDQINDSWGMIELKK